MEDACFGLWFTVLGGEQESQLLAKAVKRNLLMSLEIKLLMNLSRGGQKLNGLLKVILTLTSGRCAGPTFGEENLSCSCPHMFFSFPSQFICGIKRPIVLRL